MLALDQFLSNFRNDHGKETTLISLVLNELCWVLSMKNVSPLVLLRHLSDFCYYSINTVSVWSFVRYGTWRHHSKVATVLLWWLSTNLTYTGAEIAERDCLNFRCYHYCMAVTGTWFCSPCKYKVMNQLIVIPGKLKGRCGNKTSTCFGLSYLPFED